ncbi:MAG: TSUP family transporter, partial [Candidatus Binatia bacterium]
MTFSLIALLASLGALGGFAAGLLGVGGGVVMFPLLYYIPPLFGWAPLDAKTVAAVVSSQVFFSALFGGWAHLRRGQVHHGITVTAGVASAAGALIGAAALLWRAPALPQIPRRTPAASFAEAEARLWELDAREGGEVGDLCRSRIWRGRTDSVVVLLHGYTNCPHQYHQLGGLLRAQGHTVL